MLEDFGLTQTEEKVYLILSRIGESTASDIIKKTQLHRTTIYDVLERLIEKGLASSIIKNKIRYYSPANPSKFLDIATEEKTKAEVKQKLAKDVMAEIRKMEKVQQKSTNAQIFVGINGQKTIMKDIIDVGKDFLIFGSQGAFKEELPIYTEQWANKRRKKNIKAKIIATKGTKTPTWKLNEIKFIPKEYQSPATTIIYGEKVALFIHEEPILIILIESKKLVESYKSYFGLLWKIAKP